VLAGLLAGGAQLLAPAASAQDPEFNARAFVALYADPARARELAPAIRRRARRGGAVVERLRRVTIVWVKRPDATLREGARACLAGARP
jgi:hypothetical protein